MLQIPIREVVESVDPILKLLRSRPDEIFNRPFAGYALCLFGAPDEGVASWFSRTLISVDSLTGEDIACLVFAGKTKIRGRIGHSASFKSLKNAAGEYDLEEVRQIDRNEGEYCVSSLVDNATSLWRQSDRDFTVVTYAVDRIAGALNITDKVPCIVFFDAVLSADPSLDDVKSRPLAIFPFKDNPGSEAIRFLRRVLHRLRNSDGFAEYLTHLREFVHCERELRRTSSRIPPKRRQIEVLKKERQASLERLAWSRDQLFKVVSGASIKGLHQVFVKNPDLDSALIGLIEARLMSFKEELTHLSKTIGSLEYYCGFEPWPLSEGSRNRLSVVVERYARKWIPDLWSIESRTSCEDVLDTLKRRQGEVVDAILRGGPNFGHIEEVVSKKVEPQLAQLNSEIDDLGGIEKALRIRLEQLLNSCTAPGVPSIVQAVLKELDIPIDSSTSRDNTSPRQAITVVMMPNCVTGDAYFVKQAGAVGPGAHASDMSFITGHKDSRAKGHGE